MIIMTMNMVMIDNDDDEHGDDDNNDDEHGDDAFGANHVPP